MGEMLMQYYTHYRIANRVENSTEERKAYMQKLISNKDDKVILNFYNIAENLLDKKRQTVLQLYLTKYVKSQYLVEISSEDNRIEFQEDATKIIEPYLISLGSYIIEELIKNNLVEKSKQRINSEWKTIYFNIVDKQFISCIASATFDKPRLVRGHLSNANTYDQEKLHITLGTSESPIKNGWSTFIYPKEELLRVIEQASDTRYTISSLQVNRFLTLVSSITAEIPLNIESEDIQVLFQILYDIDLKIIIKNYTNKVLLSKIVEYGLDFKSMLDYEELATEAKQVPISKYLWDTVLSYKYFLIGFFNEINIYKHFNYFYLPKYLASTGRMFTRGYFLNLQSFKIIQSFVTFWHQPIPLIDENSFNKMQSIFNAHLQDSSTVTYPAFLYKSKELYTEHIHKNITSYFK